jgi:hypothetical protein
MGRYRIRCSHWTFPNWRTRSKNNVFERERTDAFVVELAIVLYNSGVILHKIERVLGWIGADYSHVAVWNWIQKFGQEFPIRLFKSPCESRL